MVWPGPESSWRERHAVLLLGVVALLVPSIASKGCDGASAEDRPGSVPDPCRTAIEVAGEVRRSQVVCRGAVLALEEALRVSGAPERCAGRPSRKLTPGDRVVLRKDCGVRIEPMTGARLLALGLPVDLNRASPADLQALPGIGPKLAERIHARRGSYRAAADLLRVRGIGARLLARLRPYVLARTSSSADTVGHRGAPVSAGEAQSSFSAAP